MPRLRRAAVRWLAAAAVAAGAGTAWIAWTGRGDVADVLPPGAFLAVEARGAAAALAPLRGSRFAEAFARSSTRDWLVRTAAVRALDGIRAALRRATGFAPGRETILAHTLGAEAAVAWYRGGAPAPPSWVAAFRLSAPAGALAQAARLAARLGILPGGIAREEAAGRTVFSLGARGGETVHVFLAGRTAVAGPDLELVRSAARCSAAQRDPLTREESWRTARGNLPGTGELFVWADGKSLPPALARSLGGVPRAVGALVRAAPRTEVHLFAPGGGPPGEAATVPALALLRSRPLLLFASGGPQPEAVRSFLAARAREAARAGAPGPGALPPSGKGFALALTDAAAGAFFPLPRGVLVVGMGGPAEAREAVRRLFPAGARTARAGAVPAFVTRESLPLAGEFELWGAAVGPWLVLGTSPEELAGIDAQGGGLDADDARGVVVPGRRLEAVAALDMGKALPVLRRYGPPLAGLLQARYRDVPDLARDLDLLAAVRSATAFAVSAPEGPRALVTVQLGDLP